ncbi:hypothetical protein [Bdellovibrio sp. BCCA]|uniref:hypothetical protein n=1 Tax=Bdellovibrio sp. BCCA TaxID=3136281 RepID=UPI0030F01E05
MKGMMYFSDRFIECNGSGNPRFMEFFDIDKDLVRSNPPRTKQEFPYSFDPFTIWGGPSPKCNATDWTDCLHSFDSQKYSSAGKEVFGDGRWFGEGLNGKKVQQFLNAYYGRNDLILTRVIEYCNMSTQYITYRIDYHDPRKK